MRVRTLPSRSSASARRAVAFCGFLIVDGHELQNLQFPLPSRSNDFDNVTRLLTHQALSDWRGSRNLATRHIGLFTGDQRVLDLLFLCIVINFDYGTEGDTIFGNIA